MKRKALAVLLASLMAIATAAPAFAAQPQGGQPGLTEGRNGPPPHVHH